MTTRDLETIAAETIDRLRSALASKTEEAERLRRAVTALADEWEARGNKPVHFAYHEQHAADTAEADTYYRCGETLRAALSSPESAPAPDAARCGHAHGDGVASDCCWPAGRGGEPLRHLSCCPRAPAPESAETANSSSKETP